VVPCRRIHICCLSEGLDELPLRKQRDPFCVARFVARAGRFSVFESTANPTIASTLAWLIEQRWLELESQLFPWTAAKLSPLGARMLGRAA
jgi:hypothetical protein